MKRSKLKLLVEDDVIGRLERERVERLRRDVGCLKTATELQDLRAAIERCRDSGTEGLGEVLGDELTRRHRERRSANLHLRMS
jgi:hypothetical protein